VHSKLIETTPFGPVVIIWTPLEDGPRIVRVLLSTPRLGADDQAAMYYPAARVASCAEVDEVAEGMRGFLEGGDVEFSLDVASLDSCSPFQQSVLRAEHAIPRGSVSTYQLIAAHLGSANGARAVGNALAKNPFPLIVPCHRAVRSTGHLGGFQGGLEMKRALLEMEGVGLDDVERVVVERFHYERPDARSA
jgi:methylated-DNA-[protein]-cysteine S-methyltransferase